MHKSNNPDVEWRTVGVNLDKPEKWKSDIAESVDFYNSWFLSFAPKTYRDTRVQTTKSVIDALAGTANLTKIDPSTLRHNPAILAILRMATAPPIAQDRLTGLAGVSKSVVLSMENRHRVPPKMSEKEVDNQLQRIGGVILKLADLDLFHWLQSKDQPTAKDVERAATVVADRLCGAMTDPMIRNEQEKRQLNTIAEWLKARGYSEHKNTEPRDFQKMSPGTYGFRVNIPVKLRTGKPVKIPVDAVIIPKKGGASNLPLLVEAKSAGDFTNVNKRRKEEATKMTQLRDSYRDVRYVLFLCGYFDSGYLGYEASEGIDWVWEHRIDDLSEFGV